MPTAQKFQLEVIHERKLVERVYTMEPSEHDPTKKVCIATERTRVVPESYMVYFPGGHSIWVESKAQLAAMQLLPSDNAEIDTETGLPVIPPVVKDFKRLAERTAPVSRGQGVI